ncbi:ANTAR domain-containing protein [Streptomyces sp. NBC_01558]|uniref:ANTAR domain-containing protein n=1 Tax=Streptomyces sp. NBC_01558 TaxID=2975878 RepID=UPI002DDC4B60|nr:ANTAR domain-containing protein [Streptomyces sp. NBC_01558]WSD74991.1 ANTAR domain-containing protein [Streptomyces sp. NBC_01558]
MGHRRCSADEAFAILRSASQQRRISLHDVCIELWLGRKRPVQCYASGTPRALRPTGRDYCGTPFLISQGVELHMPLEVFMVTVNGVTNDPLSCTASHSAAGRPWGRCFRWGGVTSPKDFPGAVGTRSDQFRSLRSTRPPASSEERSAEQPVPALVHNPAAYGLTYFTDVLEEFLRRLDHLQADFKSRAAPAREPDAGAPLPHAPYGTEPYLPSAPVVERLNGTAVQSAGRELYHRV